MNGHNCSWGLQCAQLRTWHNVMRKRVRVFDNGGATFDRYTVMILRRNKSLRKYEVYGMSENAMSPQGFNQFSHVVPSVRYLASDNIAIGKRIRYVDLPKEVLTAIEARI